MILLEVAAIAALAPLLLLLCEWWDRRTIAKRDAFIARITCHASNKKRPTGQEPADKGSATTSDAP
jgi:hypothetical protein